MTTTKTIEWQKVHFQLANAVTEYDRKQEGKRGYNLYALGMYLDAVHRIDEVLPHMGGDSLKLRSAIIENFNGRLLDRCLVAVGLDKATDRELKFGF